ncbi:hypothetical protein AWB77_01492 [Caballeronia fortuita]|uniref:Uncharacterized protein n=1 Tax=Caballeronia fortuita TaxID=1777138 RepID=A0A158A8C7_9BURK|nr:hypothetical protein [Caballeronia fortuita]SAK54010.1 hypothetical protein AWB77_01492 [Caballeronia fortuita]
MSQSEHRNPPSNRAAQDTLAFKYIDTLVQKHGGNASATRRLDVQLKQDATFTAVDYTLAKRK